MISRAAVVKPRTSTPVPGIAILAIRSRPGWWGCEGKLHQDTGAAHDQRRDSVTIAFGRTREKERKSKPSELRRVE